MINLPPEIEAQLPTLAAAVRAFRREADGPPVLEASHRDR